MSVIDYSGETMAERQKLQRWERTPVASDLEISNNEAYMHAMGRVGPWRFYLVNENRMRHVEPRGIPESTEGRDNSWSRVGKEAKTDRELADEWFRSPNRSRLVKGGF